MMFEKFLSEQNQSVRKYWNEMDEIGRSRKVDVDSAWDKVYSRLENDNLLHKKRILSNPVFRIAASIIIIIGLTLTGLYIGSNVFNNTPLNTITAGVDQKNISVTLPDGSEVFLNRNSSIEYPDEFNQKERTVKLNGEAFFDIKKDESRPFTIDAGNAKVTVLGTSFNVNTADEKVEVYVTTGRVMLNSNDGKHSITLNPGDIGSLSDNSVASKVNTDPNYISWKTEVLRFEGDNLAKVISDLKKVHNINIEVENEDINKLRFTSVFNKQSPDTIIRIICTTFNLQYSKEENIYFLDNK